MQLRLPWSAPLTKSAVRVREIEVEGRRFPIEVARHPWARRYVLRVTPEGAVRLTVPRGASVGDGLTFVGTQKAWIATEWARQSQRATWLEGTLIWCRGEQAPLLRDDHGLRCGAEAIHIPARSRGLRLVVQAHFRTLATAELPDRCLALGVAHGFLPSKVTIRDQRSRWGACSARGAITLNWRLVQMPPEVADYVMLHELVHLEQPNHSPRFWRRVASVCPEWRAAERWLRAHGRELL